MASIVRDATSIAIDAWCQRFRSEDDIELLRSILPKVQDLIDKAKWRFFLDLYVVELIKLLTDTAYDAQDLLNEFDDEIRHREVTGELGQADPQGNRFFNWACSFVYRGISNRRSNKANYIYHLLSHHVRKLEGTIKFHFPTYHVNFRISHTSPFFTNLEVLGREKELEEVISVLISSGVDLTEERTYVYAKKRKMENFPALPIISKDGLGKTTLAQLAYNDPRVCGYFQLKIWINVSDHIDGTSAFERLVMKIKECATNVKGRQSDSSDLGSSLMEIEQAVESKRFLIVLDDVWRLNVAIWERLCMLFRGGIKGSIIMVTTSSLMNADIIVGSSDIHPIYLEPLPYHTCWDLLKRCIPSLETASCYRDLVEIGKRIVENLEGYPSAVKILGAVLRTNLSVNHWTTVMMFLDPSIAKRKPSFRALWQSYLDMPVHLKQCLSICSIFPIGYSIDKDSLVNMWVAEGLIAPQKNILMEKMGDRHFQGLVSRSFFHQSHPDPSSFVIHSLMHMVIQKFSEAECFRIEEIEGETEDEKKIPETTRHLLVCTNHLDETLLSGWAYRNKLRSLLILGRVNNLSSIIDYLLNEFPNLRSLVLRYCNIKELPESIGNLKHLRYLDISRTSIQTLPESLSCLYNLQVIDMLHCPIKTLPKSFTNLTNLRKLYMQNEMFSTIPEIGRLTSLQEFPPFAVQKKPGFGIEELTNMRQLSECLWLKCLENVDTKTTALEARLDNKIHLDKLVLEWSPSRHTNVRYENFTLDEDVLEGLKPHLNLKLLQVGYYCGGKFPSWFGSENLPCLSKLWLKDCYYLRQLPVFPRSLAVLKLVNVALESLPELCDSDQIHSKGKKECTNSEQYITSSYLSEMHIERCPNLSSLENWPSSFSLPALKSIYIGYCEELVWLPVEGLKGSSSLEIFEIVACPNIRFQIDLVFPSSIKRLVLDSCGDLERSLPGSLQNLTSLSNLVISSFQHLEALPAVQALKKLEKLEYLKIHNCKNLFPQEALDELLVLGIKEIIIS